MMKKVLICLFLLVVSFETFASLTIDKLEPAFWWTGMKNPELQVMVYGTNIANAQVEVLTPGVTLKEVVKADCPDYLFLYFDLSQATPGKVNLLFRNGKDKKKLSYELKARTVAPESHKGFSTADVLYLLMPDRFSNGNLANDKLPQLLCQKVDRQDPNGRHGGDLAGIEKHLDYISDLGVTAIWLNPVLENDMPNGSYHGYATTNFYNIDPRFGSNEAYKLLIDEAHQKGLKVVMDMIFNHCGREHVWLKKPPFKDWFNFSEKYTQTNHAKSVSYDPYASDYDKKIMYDGWFVEDMPDLNQRNPHLAKYLIQNSIWWIEYSGIDAIRQDTYPYADATMMAEWCKEVMAEYPNFNIVGEAWFDYSAGGAYWQAHSKLNKNDTRLKTVMDFALMIASHDAFHKETNWDSGLTKLYDILGLDFLYPDINNLLVFLENHDTDRFLREMPQDLSIFKQAYAFLFTTRGIPQIYYGSEILMNGVKAKSDGYVRLDFPGGWPDDKLNSFVPEGRSDLQNEAFDYMRKLLNWRKNNEVIAKGTLRHFVPRNGVYVYLRSYHGKNVLVMLNGKNSPNTLPMDQYAEVLNGITSARDIITGKTLNFGEELTLTARETLILEY